MVSKYIKTIQLFTKLPTTNSEVHDGSCKITNPFRMEHRPCNETHIQCFQCIYGKSSINKETVNALKSHSNTDTSTSIE